LLVRHLSELVDYEFTAKMEDGLDAIANGEHKSTPWLRHFYFGETNGGTKDHHITDLGLKRLVGEEADQIDARSVSTIPIGVDEDGQQINVRVGRYGPYVQIGDDGQRANIPDDLPPDELTVAKALELAAAAAQSGRSLGNDPQTAKPVYLKNGRFGPYVQLGDPELTEKGTVKRGGKPKMASLWPNMTLETLTLDEALMLLSFPRDVGVHPTTNEPIVAQDGRYGPYLKMGTETRSLEKHEQLGSLTLEEAVTILAQPKRGRGSATTSVIAELGPHPKSGDPLVVKNGRFGPYVTDGVVNATIPRGKDPTQVSLEDAVSLIAAREEKMREQGKDPRAPKPVRKTTRKKTAARKTTTRKKSRKTTGKAAKAAAGE